ncbi:MAG TPA: hypothetical protein VIU62_10675 [Chloroflexota bacterium]
MPHAQPELHTRQHPDGGGAAATGGGVWVGAATGAGAAAGGGAATAITGAGTGACGNAVSVALVEPVAQAPWPTGITEAAT